MTLWLKNMILFHSGWKNFICFVSSCFSSSHFQTQDFWWLHFKYSRCLVRHFVWGLSESRPDISHVYVSDISRIQCYCNTDLWMGTSWTTAHWGLRVWKSKHPPNYRCPDVYGCKKTFELFRCIQPCFDLLLNCKELEKLNSFCLFVVEGLFSFVHFH